MKSFRMKFYLKSAGLLLLLLFIGIKPLIGQSQNNDNRLSGNNESNLSETYFFDQAGLQLANQLFSLDEFIDPDNYQLGPYDILSIFGKGVIEFNYRGLAVSASGDIVIPVAGMVSVKGLTLTEAKDKIQRVFQKTLKNSEISVSLDQPRPVSVHLGGQIPNPGKYTIQPGTRYSALISGLLINQEIVYPLQNLPNSTIQSPNSPITVTGINFEELEFKNKAQSDLTESFFKQISVKYDLRRVKVTNNSGDTHYVDLSAYFNSGHKNFNPYIADGDEINFIERSSTSPKISISGAVINNFEGTFRTDDTFKKLFNISGGFAPGADTSNFIVYRGVNGTVEKLSFSYGDEITLQPNDRIIIPHTQEQQSIGSVYIDGQVMTPGIYSITEDKTTLNDLLQMAGGLNDKALPKAGYLYRQSFDNRGVKSVSAFSPSLLIRSSDQYLEGFDYMKLEEALNVGRMPIDFTDETLLSQLTLSDGDQLFIPKNEYSVSLMGQINKPGFYNFKQNYTLTDYINRAEGLTVAANPDRIFIIKAGSRSWLKPSETELSSGDIIFVDRTPLVDATSGRTFEFQKEQLKNNRFQLLLAAISTITSIITTYVAITR
jgi:protein involved in polysaccharide export with SLBB domain